MAGGVVITVVLHRKTGGFKQCTVVFPAWIADRDYCAWLQLLKEVSTDFQRAGTANGLSGDHPASCQQRRLGTEQQLLHGLVVGGNTIDRQITARRVLGNPDRFGFDNGTQERNSSLFVAVNTNPQVHFAGTGIGVECFVEAQDRIAWCHFDSGEQAHYYGGSEWGMEGVTTLQPIALERCTNGEQV